MKTHVNLLPGSYRRRILIRRRVAQWSAAWALGLISALVTGWTSYARYQQALQVSQAHERAYAPLQFLKDETARTQVKLTELSTQESVLEQLRDDRPSLSILGQISRSARQCDGRIRVDTFNLLRDIKAVKPGTRSPGTLVVKGTGLDNLAVARFVVALRATSAFEQVDLKSSVGTKIEGDTERTFVVECQF